MSYMRYQRHCETCGKAFTATRSVQDYCTKACRQKAYRQRNADRGAPDPSRHAWGLPIRLRCQACGRFFRARRTPTKYCSAACRQKAYRRRRQER